MTAQDEDCKVRPCPCTCHSDAEEPGPHAAGCAWADERYEPRSASACRECRGTGVISGFRCGFCSSCPPEGTEGFHDCQYREALREHLASCPNRGTPSDPTPYEAAPCGWCKHLWESHVPGGCSAIHPEPCDCGGFVGRPPRRASSSPPPCWLHSDGNVEHCVRCEAQGMSPSASRPTKAPHVWRVGDDVTLAGKVTEVEPDGALRVRFTASGSDHFSMWFEPSHVRRSEYDQSKPKVGDGKVRAVDALLFTALAVEKAGGEIRISSADIHNSLDLTLIREEDMMRDIVLRTRRSAYAKTPASDGRDQRESVEVPRSLDRGGNERRPSQQGVTAGETALVIDMQTPRPKVTGEHVHRCPVCYEAAPCLETCSIEMDLTLDDGTPCGAYVTCATCTKTSQTEPAHPSDAAPNEREAAGRSGDAVAAPATDLRGTFKIGQRVRVVDGEWDSTWVGCVGKVWTLVPGGAWVVGISKETLFFRDSELCDQWEEELSHRTGECADDCRLCSGEEVHDRLRQQDETRTGRTSSAPHSSSSENLFSNNTSERDENGDRLQRRGREVRAGHDPAPSDGGRHERDGLSPRSEPADQDPCAQDLQRAEGGNRDAEGLAQGPRPAGKEARNVTETPSSRKAPDDLVRQARAWLWSRDLDPDGPAGSSLARVLAHVRLDAIEECAKACIEWADRETTGPEPVFVWDPRTINAGHALAAHLRATLSGPVGGDR